MPRKRLVNLRRQLPQPPIKSITKYPELEDYLAAAYTSYRAGLQLLSLRHYPRSICGDHITSPQLEFPLSVAPYLSRAILRIYSGEAIWQTVHSTTNTIAQKITTGTIRTSQTKRYDSHDRPQVNSTDLDTQSFSGSDGLGSNIELAHSRIGSYRKGKGKKGEIMRRHSLLSLSSLILAHATLGSGSQKSFNVHDDVLAFPQYEVVFPYEYILASDADKRLTQQRSSSISSPSPSPDSSSISQSDRSSQQQAPLRDDDTSANDKDTPLVPEENVERYEEMILDGMRYLCTVPKVVTVNATEAAGTTPAEQEKELARAADRGLELLSEMKGRCMYYVAGWWSYSFCYMDQVRQFHALPPGNGVPVYPPAEDPATHSYVLGRFRTPKKDNGKKKGSGQTPRENGSEKRPSTEVAELQTKGDSRYLVQHLEDGTTCDLTGRDRKIEVQFHCHPQSTDRIGWIKEVSTCTYLMVIYTPRLCNDVAFQPPREDDPNHISCREVLEPDMVAEFEEAKAFAESGEDLNLLDLNLDVEGAGAMEKFPIVGDIEVGAMKLVGREGKRIEKGKVASLGEEKVEIVAKRKGGEIQKLSKEELKKFNLDSEKIEALKKQLEELARGKDWKLEMIEANGRSTLRGVIDTGDEEEGEEEGEGDKKTGEDGEGNGKGDAEEREGADNGYKEEL
ncbi:hypothetical protein AJ79_05663 [Helicocarpus griseus UAMH5409]|uniref:Endoplasmic reticulum lectin n=1 Tax=Helicocarpus griseus UAMH5409 TaxID=1447875 RepID=A0A2B7XM17_9EURO|nr:hypothetical protein AJ79_05663 [Helicocarpus griseus UAMH5409]